ncbi:MAG: hypothetical protein LBQ30_07585, partial [Treponema sp.]|nr:hypothetical protein [Treponema sp.]
MKDYILSKLDDYKGVFNERPTLVPSNSVVDAPIAGNGDIGIVLNSIDTTAGKGHPGWGWDGGIGPIPVDNAVEVYFTKNDFWLSSYSLSINQTYGMKSIGKLVVIFE